MTPEIDGPNRHYRATGAFNLSFFLALCRAGQEGLVARACNSTFLTSTFKGLRRSGYHFIEVTIEELDRCIIAGEWPWQDEPSA
jgi:hypothetical protein